MKLSAILIGAAVASDYDYDALGNKKCKFRVRDSANNQRVLQSLFAILDCHR